MERYIDDTPQNRTIVEHNSGMAANHQPPCNLDILQNKVNCCIEYLFAALVNTDSIKNYLRSLYSDT